MGNRLSTILKGTKIGAANVSKTPIDYTTWCTVEQAKEITGLSIPRIRQIGDEGTFGTKNYVDKRVYYHVDKVQEYKRKQHTANLGKEGLEYRRSVKRVIESGSNLIEVLGTDLGLDAVKVATTKSIIVQLVAMAREALQEVQQEDKKSK